MKPILHEGEEILLEIKPDTSSVNYFFLSKCWHIAIIIIWVAFFVLTDGDNSASESYDKLSNLMVGLSYQVETGLVILILLILLVIRSFIKRMINGYDYVITNQRVILHYGFLAINRRVLSYDRITDIDMRSGFVERLFGFGSVYLDTTVSMLSNNSSLGANTTRLEGLSLDDCEQVMHSISEQIQSKK